MKKIVIVFGTFITVTAIFLGLTNIDEIKAYINNKDTDNDTLVLTESNEWSVDEDESTVEAFVETEKGSEFKALPEGERPDKGERPEGFDKERPIPPEDGTFPEEDTHTGTSSTTTE